jgi:DNA-binding response OmpR family regulator
MTIQVLLVEDDNTLRHLYANRLRQSGMAVMDFERFDDALLMVPFSDFVLFDLVSPESSMSWKSFCNQVRESAVPFGVISASPESAQQSGADVVLSKTLGVSLEWDALSSAIRRSARRSKRESEG